MPRDHIDLDGSNLVVERDVPVPSETTIMERKGWGHPDTLADHLAERLSRAYSRYTLREFGGFRLNARDLLERDELYLTYTGSSIESGDEGVVGRGNRVSGLITPLRPMNVEGANGKNPVYHVGKLYNVAAHRIAHRLHEATGAYAEVHLISATGQRLDRPWRIVVRLAEDGVGLADDKLRALLLETLDAFPALTREILSGDGMTLA